MLRYTRQIATSLTLLFAAMVAACPVIACTGAPPQETAVVKKHACCPKSPKPAQKHSTKSSGDCPLLMTEFRAGFVKDEVRPAAVLAVAIAASSVVVAPASPMARVAVEHLAPDRGDLCILHRVLRI